MLFKDEKYKAEQEYRAILMCDYIHTNSDKYCKQEFRSLNDYLIPFIKENINIKESLRDIMIGPIINYSTAKTGLQEYLKSKSLDVRLAKSRLRLRY